MKTKILLSFFALALILSSCNDKVDNIVDTGKIGEAEIQYVWGEVLIGLEEGIPYSQAKQRIEELDLEWEKFFDFIDVALIGVPIGEEKHWVDKLAEEPIIKFAELNGIYDIN